jgi:hypothetical protein
MDWYNRNNPWAKGGRLDGRLPWAQQGMQYGWQQSSPYFQPKSEAQIQREALLQLAILAAVIAAPAVVGALGGGGAAGGASAAGMGTAAEAAGETVGQAALAGSSGSLTGGLASFLPFLSGTAANSLMSAASDSPSTLNHALHAQTPSWVFDPGTNQDTQVDKDGRHPGMDMLEELSRAIEKDPELRSELANPELNLEAVSREMQLLLQAGQRDRRKKKKRRVVGTSSRKSIAERLLLNIGTFLTAGDRYYELGKYRAYMVPRSKFWTGEWRIKPLDLRDRPVAPKRIPKPKPNPPIPPKKKIIPPHKIPWAGNYFIPIFLQIQTWMTWSMENELGTVYSLGEIFDDPTSGGTDHFDNGNATNIAPGVRSGSTVAWNFPNWIGFTKSGPGGRVPTESEFLNVKIDLSQITIYPLSSVQDTRMAPFFGTNEGIRDVQILSLIQIGGTNGPVIASNMDAATTARNIANILDLPYIGVGNGSFLISLIR